MKRRIALIALAIVILVPVGFVHSESPDPARIKQLAESLPAGPYCATPLIEHREFWGKVGQSPLFEGLAETASAEAEGQVQPLPDDLYLEYSRNGNRSNYQNAYFKKLKSLRTLVVAECVENRGRFIVPIRRLIDSYAQDKTWVIPAHDKNLENFKGVQITIDLFASEVACDLAATDYLLGDRLGQGTRKQIRAEIKRRIFDPYKSAVRNGEPRLWWLTGTNNWNAVCLANVTGTALALIDDPMEKAFYLASAEKHVAHFLQGFTPDGYCSEGIGYWNYGFGCFVRLGHMLSEATSGEVDLFELPKAQSAALFPRRMEITPGLYPAFADCTVGSKPGANIMAYLTRRYALTPTDWERHHLSTPRWLDEFGVYSFVVDRPEGDVEVAELPQRDWFEDAEVLVCRGGMTKHGLPWGLAAKGGHNDEHHNHNDVGTYVVCIGGDMPLTDPGAEVYTRRTFSRQRYDSDVLNSFGHPVPRVAGQLQRSGRDARARVLKTEFASDADQLVLDLSAAYRVESLVSLQRSITYQRQPALVTVTDAVAFSAPQAFGTAIVTFQPWKKLTDTQIQIGQGSQAILVDIDSQSLPVTIESVKIDEDVRGGKRPTRIGIDLKQPAPKAQIRLTARPKA
jgi:hypothetical protein